MATLEEVAKLKAEFPGKIPNFSIVPEDQERALHKFFDDKVVLVDGATGSFGRKFIRNLNRFKCKKIIVFSRDELKQSEMQVQFRDMESVMRYFIGDVRDFDRLLQAFEGVDYVVHAAALKQVPALEYNPFEAIKTNVLGGQNIVRACVACGVKRCVALSTDKAANPINLYGASKLASDKLFVAGNAMAGKHDTKFAVVRYGNVFGSRGSVIPVFMKMKKAGGPLTITDEGMTRFNMSLQQAVNFVLQSFLWMQGGEVFIPKIPSYKIAWVAAAVAPSMPTKVTGIRPGEKLYEVMVPEDEARNTIEFDTHYIITPMFNFWNKDLYKDKPVCPTHFAYRSDTNTDWVTMAQLRYMVKQYCIEYGIEDEIVHTDLSKSSLDSKLALDGGRPIRDSSLPYGRHNVDEGDIREVVASLRNAMLTTGPKVDEFEQALAAKLGVKYAVAVNSGTAALHCAVFGGNIGPGDEVIVASMSFAASANCVVYQGATPVFCDVLPDSLNIDVAAAAKLITPKTKAIISVDYTGNPCDKKALKALADKHKLFLISDAAHAPGAEYDGKPISVWSDATTFSFHPVKHITTAEGGAITTNSEEVYKRMKLFRNHGLNSTHMDREKAGTFAYQMTDLGYNYRLPDTQCALGMSQLKKLDDYVEQRRAIAAMYNKALASVPEVTTLKETPNSKAVYHIYIVLFNLDMLTVDRDQLYKALRAENIGVNVHYVPIYLHPYYKNTHGTKEGLAPVCENGYKRMLTFPIWPGMSPEDVDDCVNAIKKVVAAYRKK